MYSENYLHFFLLFERLSEVWQKLVHLQILWEKNYIQKTIFFIALHFNYVKTLISSQLNEKLTC